ncbi:YkvA family protein [Fictibacillus sp. b24]|uniref:YkvA family protein n=1 Tax=unclassified Fictibacillus TaxID=2644029 RepID=UPI0025A2EE86|nr:YkvA family protein [Fictibacillus sp. b24]MDM5317860.1 YkvA family protein [Fictibacillus sp. b24]
MRQIVDKIKHWAKEIKRQLYVLYLVSRHQDVPIYAKALAITIVAYALSPIDLIPDFIPLLGFLDDILLLPLGIVIVFRWISPSVLEECKKRAADQNKRLPKNWIAGGVILTIWVTVLILLVKKAAEL